MNEKKLKDVTLSKADIYNSAHFIHTNMTDGDIFRETRMLQEDGKRQGCRITNIGEIYFWYKDIRNERR